MRPRRLLPAWDTRSCPCASAATCAGFRSKTEPSIWPIVFRRCIISPIPVPSCGKCSGCSCRAAISIFPRSRSAVGFASTSIAVNAWKISRVSTSGFSIPACSGTWPRRTSVASRNPPGESWRTNQSHLPIGTAASPVFPRSTWTPRCCSQEMRSLSGDYCFVWASLRRRPNGCQPLYLGRNCRLFAASATPVHHNPRRKTSGSLVAVRTVIAPCAGCRAGKKKRTAPRPASSVRSAAPSRSTTACICCSAALNWKPYTAPRRKLPPCPRTSKRALAEAVARTPSLTVRGSPESVSTTPWEKRSSKSTAARKR